MSNPYRGQIKVRFADTDANGHAFFGNYFVFADEVLGEYWSELWLDVADVVVLKPMFLGALRRTLDLAADAQRRGTGVCLTHALGSPVERLGVQHLTATLDDDGVHGVGHPADGDRLSLPSGPGLGVRP